MAHTVCYANLLQKYLWVRIMEHNFEYISYIRISGSQNQVIGAPTNFVLNWKINHQVNESSHTPWTS